jgi:dienelactone hydrolase
MRRLDVPNPVPFRGRLAALCLSLAASGWVWAAWAAPIDPSANPPTHRVPSEEDRRTNTAAAISAIESEAAGRTIPARFTPSPRGESAPLIVRLAGLPGDQPLGAPAASYLSRGYGVLELDFGESPLPTAAMMRDVLRLRRRIAAEMADRVDIDHIFVVPETHSLEVDQPFFTHEGFIYRLDVLQAAGAPAPTAIQFSHRVESRRENRAFVAYDDAMLDGLALRGFTVVLADHHGADVPERRIDRMPLQVAHGRAALSLVVSRAEDWNVDPDRLALVGFSKGGATAALLAGVQNANDLSADPGVPPVRATVVLGAYLDQARLLQDGGDPGSSRWQDNLAAWGDPASTPTEWNLNSAITYVDGGDPPMFLVAGDKDDYRPAQARRTASALAAAAVPYHLIIEPELEHRLPSSDAAWNRIFAFLDETLAQPR